MTWSGVMETANTSFPQQVNRGVSPPILNPSSIDASNYPISKTLRARGDTARRYVDRGTADFVLFGLDEVCGLLALGLYYHQMAAV